MEQSFIHPQLGYIEVSIGGGSDGSGSQLAQDGQIEVSQVEDGADKTVEVLVAQDGHDELLEDGRVAEDAIRQVDLLDEESQSNPTVKKLVSAVKHLEKSCRTLKRENMSLSKEVMSAEMQIKEVQKSSATDVCEMLLPMIKKTMLEANKGLVGSLKEEVKQAVKESQSSLVSTIDGIKTTLTNMAANLTQLNSAAQNTGVAVSEVDKKLVASGIIVNDDPNSQVDLAEVVLQINSKVNGAVSILEGSSDTSAPIPLNLVDPIPVPIIVPQEDTLSGQKSKLSLRVGLKKSDNLTPLHKAPSSTLTPSSTPTKPSPGSRWGKATPSKSTPPTMSSTTMASSVSTVRQLNSKVGETCASNPYLFKLMSRASNFLDREKEHEESSNKRRRRT